MSAADNTDPDTRVHAGPSPRPAAGPEQTPQPPAAHATAAHAPAATTAHPPITPTGMIGSTIGPYRLIAELGAGGMGAVYLADQQHPVRRQVALKLIHHGMQSPDLARRFQSEGELLARMNHPNIAQVLDIGASEDGRLYFAMEYVPGVPLSEFCDRRGIDLQGRLELFLQACEGVQHAHQKGVIHRDLKPSNLMVADYHGQRLLKVIDFGIAKGVDDFGRLDPGSTRIGTPIGTPAYMSPEQARGDPAAIDTRTDVYALGGVLYKLLTDETPVPSELISRSTEADFARLLDETPIHPPSRRVLAIAQTGDSDWKRRMDSDFLGHARRLRGDLDWITLKALETDRSRRYASVSELAADLRRHLQGEPVLASPPGAGYRIGKFVRRHRIAVAAGGAVAAALVAGLVGTGWMAVEARAQRERAEAALVQAEHERDRAVAVGAFLEGMIAAPDPWKLEGARPDARLVKVVDVLADAVATFEAGIERNPVLYADIGVLLGRTLRRLGESVSAERVLRTAVAALAAHAPESPSRDAAMAELGLTLTVRGAFAEADAEFVGLLDAGGRTLEDRLADEVGRVAADVALVMGDEARAEQVARELLARVIARDGDDGTSASGARATLAYMLGARGQWEEAEALADAAYRSELARLGPGHPVVIQLLSGTAELALRRGDYALARDRYASAAARAAAVLGEQHPVTLAQRLLVATTLDHAGDTLEAIKQFERLLPAYASALGDEHPEVLLMRANLGIALRTDGRIDAAAQVLEDVLSRRQRVLGPAHPETLRTLAFVAVLARDRGDLAQAEGLLESAAQIYAEINGPDHPESLVMRNNQLAVARDRGQVDRAVAGYQELVARARRALPAQHPHLGTMLGNQGRALALAGRVTDGEAVLSEALQILQSQFGSDDPRVERVAQWRKEAASGR
jgi:eukaryotic-like serine/threonine-protein kinase